MDRLSISNIDFLFMDIGGGGPRALAGFDIKRSKPDLVCIEAGPAVRKQISAYFESNGYERINE